MATVRDASGPGAEVCSAAHARALVQARVARLLSYRTVAAPESDGSPPQPSVARIASTLLDQEVAEVAMDALGGEAVDAGADAPLGGSVENGWRYARSSTIASGTTEIHRLLLARALMREA